MYEITRIINGIKITYETVAKIVGAIVHTCGINKNWFMLQNFV